MIKKRNLSRTLIKINSLAQNARSKQDLIDAISLLKHFPAPIKNKTRSIIPLLRAIFFLAALLSPILIVIDIPVKGMDLFPLIFLLFFGFMRLAMALVDPTHPLDEISYLIHFKNFLLENGLKEKSYSGRNKILLLKAAFKQFSPPSKKEVMYNWLDGEFAGTEHTFKFNYFHYYYEFGLPSKHTISFSRCGIMMKFNYASHIYIGPKRKDDYPLLTKYYPVEWISPSLRFNKKFMVQTNSEIDASKMLKPFLLKAILNLDSKIPGIVLELNSYGTLCLSFDQKDIVPERLHYGLRRPVYFSRMIKKSGKRKKFNTLMEFVHTLLKYSDNNFDQNINTKTGSA